MRKYEEVRAVRLPADLCIMTDDGTRGDEVLAALNPSSAGRMRFWRNGLAMERLRPATGEEREAQRRSLGIGEDGLVLITASRLVGWKRVDRAIEALAILKRSVSTCRLLVVGDGHEREALERLADQRGVTELVQFVGPVPQEAVAGYMHAADVFLAVADLSNVGNPLLEAMACGLAIVAVDAGATRDLIVDGETGCLVPTGDPALIAEAVATLARHDATRMRVAAGGRRFAEERFWTWKARMDAEVSEVEQLVGAGREAHAGQRP
jgi:glycosyltransferase involved in cell wall biosynthesis